MLFGNSLRLLMENFKNVYKILLYKTAVALVAIALSAAIVLPEFNDIWNSTVAQEILVKIREMFTLFLAGNAEWVAAKDAVFSTNGLLYHLGQLIISRALEITLVAIGCVLIFLLKRFADALCYFSVGSVINDKMGKFAETRLSMSYVENFKKACAYALVYVPIAFLFDAVAIVLSFLLIQNVNLLSALSLSVTVIVLLQCAKFLCTWHWIPAMVTDNLRLRDAMKGLQGAPKKQTGRLFSCYLTSVYFVIIFNAAAALFTCGSALILTIPTSYLFFVCLHFVQYYTLTGKKYFIRLDKIAKNDDFGDPASLLDCNTETKKAEEKE